MSGYRRYPAYKESGVEWIGEIPAGWGKKQLKFVSKIVSGATPKSGIADYWDGENIWITPTDLGACDGKIISDSERKLTDKGVSNCGTEISPAGSIVLSSRAPIGHIALTVIESCINQGCKTVIPDENSNKDFLYYLLKSSIEELRSCGQGSTFMELPTHRLRDLFIPVPSCDEQTQIAAFLDRKTAQIDRLIEIKRRQIELLKEERTAVINHAVTKGLNPEAKMKESGIEWVGEMPEGWEASRIKFCVSIANGQVDPRKSEFRDLVLIAPNHIESGTGKILFTETAHEQGAYSGKYYFESRDVLYSKIRPALQKACITDHVGLCSADMYPLTVKDNVIAEYLLYYLLSDGFTRFSVLTSDRVAMPKINREALNDCPMPVPPLCVQMEIAQYIDQNCKRIDSAILQAEKQIQLLQEYRITLISDAVTGKIDVREEAT